ncbi:hypothetical protein BN110_027 [Yersinia phage phiR8-01]|uniref:Uncharacterized protein n=1 Tax=Yersinia phage phiR8-01 TaxID=1206556 RepID=I7LEA5_9CAUD|nr:hypothetical protein HOT05_gp16 [Yersinia phage phiR8-01]CCI88397.2 hypothetical protein BN110_027 [Yersinia phage phiR8-01]
MAKAINIHRVVKIRVIFQRNIVDVLRRAPKEATFTGFDFMYFNNADGLAVRWGNKQYSYPAHKLARVVLEESEE